MAGVLSLATSGWSRLQIAVYAKFEPPERRCEPQIGPTSLKTLLHFIV